MSEESKPEAAEHQQELEETGLAPEESGADSIDPELNARSSRYGLTPEQAKMLDLYL
jgi:hypothetical protein